MLTAVKLTLRRLTLSGFTIRFKHLSDQGEVIEPLAASVIFISKITVPSSKSGRVLRISAITYNTALRPEPDKS